MDDSKTDQKWSAQIGNVSASTLVAAGVLPASERDRAAAIIAEEVLVRLSLNDRPASKGTTP
jgi:hypothetical protein